MTYPNFEWELKHPFGFIGIDEAGCGPWAGPVVAGAAFIPNPLDKAHLFTQINDSKKLSASKREQLYNLLIALEEKRNIFLGIGQASVEEIDTINIGQATRLAMVRAYENLKQKFPNLCNNAVIYVDGIKLPQMDRPTYPLIKGDQKSISIAAASIIAKVTRDNIMQKLHILYPQYAWASNAGYGTQAHQEALALYGITPHHRKSYAPIKKLLQIAS